MGTYQDAIELHGSKTKAALALGIPRTTFNDRLLKESVYSEPQKPPPNNKLNLYGISEVSVPASDEWVKVVYFTDAHNQPRMSLDRFKWLAALVNDQKPQVLLDGGDFDDFQSLCGHESNDTYKGKLKPSLANDLEASALARRILNDHLIHKCQKILCAGNHEARLWTYENYNPEMIGIPTSIYLDILKATGWQYHPYGAYVSVAGVDFTHAPFNTMGRPVGGESACKQIADKSLRDIVWGHTHKLDIWNSPKFGEARSVTAFNGGCFMPEGYIPDYCKSTRKEFFYGAHVLMVSGGRIRSIKTWSMSELQMLYGGKDA